VGKIERERSDSILLEFRTIKFHLGDFFKTLDKLFDKIHLDLTDIFHPFYQNKLKKLLKHAYQITECKILTHN